MWVTSGRLSRDRAFVYWFFLLSARPRNFDRRTEQHDEANHGVDVAKTVGDPEQQLDLVVRRLSSGLACRKAARDMSQEPRRILTRASTAFFQIPVLKTGFIGYPQISSIKSRVE